MGKLYKRFLELGTSKAECNKEDRFVRRYSDNFE